MLNHSTEINKRQGNIHRDIIHFYHKIKWGDFRQHKKYIKKVYYEQIYILIIIYKQNYDDCGFQASIFGFVVE